MCRLVAVIASEITEFGLVLANAPRSLARLSREHPDGWGIAAHCGEETSDADAGWLIQKGTVRAHECDLFHTTAAQSRGTVLIAHIRKKTVGPTRLENTHPFIHDGWVFAHNGTITDLRAVREGASAARLAQIRGDTDSELLFAFFLTRLDAEGLTTLESTPDARDRATRVLAAASAELRTGDVGAFNFVLSNSDSCFVHRSKRTLFILERGPADSVRMMPVGRAITMHPRRRAVLVASEQLTDEPWAEVPEGSFLRIDRTPIPTIVWHEGAARAAS